MNQMEITKPLTYTVGGREVSADTLMAGAKRKSGAKRDAPDEYHRGWLVEGYPPGMIEEAQRLTEGNCARWAAMSDEQRARAEKDGERAPKAWDLAQWLIRTKPKRVRSRPYEIPSAADECRAIAERGGWEHVRVTEVKKVKA